MWTNESRHQYYKNLEAIVATILIVLTLIFIVVCVTRVTFDILHPMIIKVF